MNVAARNVYPQTNSNIAQLNEQLIHQIELYIDLLIIIAFIELPPAHNE